MADEGKPAHSVSRARARVDVAQVLRRGEAIAKWLGEGMTPRQAAARARKPESEGGLGLTRSTANRYVGHVLRTLATDAAIEPIESKRARIIAAAQAALVRANSHKRVLVQDGEAMEVDDPDVQGALSALALIAKLEGIIT